MHNILMLISNIQDQAAFHPIALPGTKINCWDAEMGASRISALDTNNEAGMFE
jgi:hypothetical protein